VNRSSRFDAVAIRWLFLEFAQALRPAQTEKSLIFSMG